MRQSILELALVG
jgi:hypothetical protein